MQCLEEPEEREREVEGRTGGIRYNLSVSNTADIKTFSLKSHAQF